MKEIHPENTPLGEALIASLTELRDALEENPDKGVGQELRRILLEKGCKRITIQEARELAIRHLHKAELPRQEAIEREAKLDTWNDDGGQQ